MRTPVQRNRLSSITVLLGLDITQSSALMLIKAIPHSTHRFTNRNHPNLDPNPLVRKLLIERKSIGL